MVAEALAVLQGVKDPEVPVISVVELGVVRDVEAQGDAVTVTITPTYSGCPALQLMERQIAAALRKAGYREVTVKTVYAPPWTTDWIAPAAREKLRACGIAPPTPSGEERLVPLGRAFGTVPCPFCASQDTVLRSAFGSTACKSLHVCRACHQPFEHIKAF